MLGRLKMTAEELAELKKIAPSRGAPLNIKATHSGVDAIPAAAQLNALQAAKAKDLAIMSGLGAGVTGIGAGTAYGLGAFDDEPAPPTGMEQISERWNSLTDAQKAMIIGGGGLAAAGGIYGLSQLG